MHIGIQKILCALFLISLIAGCGGGGSSTANNGPIIGISIASFPSNQVPPSFVQNSSNNSKAYVWVFDSLDGSPITTASVTVNGVALSYVSDNLSYQGELAIAPGSQVTVNVLVGSATYSATGHQFSTYPTISSPNVNAGWSAQLANNISWTGTASGNQTYLVGVTDANGNLIWPISDLASLPPSVSSTSIPSNSMSTGTRFVLVGAAANASIPGAAPNSIFQIAGFNYVPVNVATNPGVSLVSIAVNPNNIALSKSGSTKQLTATGTYSDSSTMDLTSQVIWATTDSTKAPVTYSGMISGANYGQATVTATLGNVVGSASVDVFQPSSAAPPTTLNSAVTYQMDYAHTGHVAFGVPFNTPTQPAWSVSLNGNVSYPLIVGGKVYVTTITGSSPATSMSLYALDEQTGNIVWGPIALNSTGILTAFSAYDNGKIFVITSDGHLQSFNATTGQAGWSTQFLYGDIANAPPTAVNGLIYISGTGTGGRLYAIDENNGGILWTSSVENGDMSSPTVTANGVFVSYPCQVYKFNLTTGASLWRYNGPCEGGGGETSTYLNSQLFVRDVASGSTVNIFDASSGAISGSLSFNSTNPLPIPALYNQTGYFLDGTTLKAIDLTSHNVNWIFTGDGHLVTAPITVDQTVFIGSSSGNVYAIDATSGALLWTGNAGASISYTNDMYPYPLSALGAGEGYLVAPAGNVLTAWRVISP